MFVAHTIVWASLYHTPGMHSDLKLSACSQNIMRQISYPCGMTA